MTLEKEFKDKINWKLFNYILDILTSYEDVGIYFKLDVGIYVEDYNFSISYIEHLFSYSSDEQSKWIDMIYEHYKFVLNYLDSDTYYVICLNKDDNLNILSEIRTKLNKKMEFVFDESETSYMFEYVY